jgi:WD40 repeat protein
MPLQILILICPFIAIVFVFPYLHVSAQGFTGLIADTEWNAIGSELAVAYRTGCVQILDASGQQLRAFQFDSLEGSLNTVSWSPGGDYLAIAGYGSLYIVDATTGIPLSTLRFTTQTWAARWNPNGSSIAINVELGLNLTGVSLVNPTTGAIDADFANTQNYRVNVLEWNSDGTLLAFGDLGGLVLVLDVENDEIVQQFSSDAEVSALAWSPDDTQLAISAIGTQIWDVSTGNLILSLSNLPMDNLSWKSDGNLLAGVYLSGAYIWNTADGRLLYAFAESSFLRAIAWRPNSDELAYGGSGSVILSNDILTLPTVTPTTIPTLTLVPTATPTFTNTPTITPTPTPQAKISMGVSPRIFPLSASGEGAGGGVSYQGIIYATNTPPAYRHLYP